MSNKINIDSVNDTDNLVDILKISRGTLNKLIQTKVLRTYKVGRRRYATGDAVRDFIKQREAETA